MPASAPSIPDALTRSRVLAAGIEVVWRRIVGPDWLGLRPDGPDDPDESDASPGDGPDAGAPASDRGDDGDAPAAGDRVRLDDPFGDGPRQARVAAVDPGRALHLEWWPAGRPDDRSTVAIALEVVEGGTRVTVTERAVPTPEVEARGRAWSSCLQALAAVVDAAASPFALSLR